MDMSNSPLFARMQQQVRRAPPAHLPNSKVKARACYCRPNRSPVSVQQAESEAAEKAEAAAKTEAVEAARYEKLMVEAGWEEQWDPSVRSNQHIGRGGEGFLPPVATLPRVAAEHCIA